MDKLPIMPSEDIKDGEIRVFTYEHMRKYAARVRADALDEAHAAVLKVWRETKECPEMGEYCADAIQALIDKGIKP